MRIDRSPARELAPSARSAALARPGRRWDGLPHVWDVVTIVCLLACGCDPQGAPLDVSGSSSPAQEDSGAADPGLADGFLPPPPAAGDLDSTFSSDGMLVTQVDPNGDDVARAICPGHR